MKAINHLVIPILLAGGIFAAPLAMWGQKKDTKARVLTKKDTVHIVGHAHQDMNWLWTYGETMKMCNDNLRQTVEFMEEFPDFHMVQSEAAVYDFVEQVDTALFSKVRKYVREGRLEPVGGMWVESDQNLPSGEGFTRSLLLGQRFFQEKFGRMSRVGWLPDDFGHTSQLPQILRLSGQNYFYFMRSGAYPGSFWWEAPDSSRVLCYTGGSYNGNVSEKELLDRFEKYAPDRHRVLHPVGVGDHGGGPTRANIDNVHRIDALKKNAPAVKFTTAEDFFKSLSKEMDGRPVHRGEMQYVFEGCYSTVAENKEGNRNCEKALYEGEFFNSLRWFVDGDKYPHDLYKDLWRNVTFNQFHDILTGSAVYESNRESVSRYMETYRKAGEARDKAFRNLADGIKFQEGLGQPIVAYNLHPYGGKMLVEADVFSHEMPATAELRGWPDFYGSKNLKIKDIGQGNVASVLVRDASGKTYPAQIVWGKTFPPSCFSKVQFVVDEMPAGGYKTFYVDVMQPGVFNEPIPFKDNTFDTDYFKIRIDPSTGDIVSLIDKKSGKEFVRDGGHLNTLRIYNEIRDGQMKSWTINKNASIEDVTTVLPVRNMDRNWLGYLENAPEKETYYCKVENGPVRACVEATKVWGNSKFIIRTYIYRSYPRIDYDVEVHWLETGGDDKESPMLRAIFPLATDDSRLWCDVPFNVVERPANGKFAGGEIPHWLGHHYENPATREDNDGQEVPAQKWVDVNDGQTGIALLNRTKYGHSYHNGELRLTLLRSAGNPDIYPNLGRFVINYSLFPHTGGWENGVMREGEIYNVPVYAAEPPSLALVKEHATKPEEASLIAVDKDNVSLSTIKQSEDGDELIVRLCEMQGKETVTEITLPKGISAARRLNLIEYPLEGASAPEIIGNKIRVKIRGHEIVTLGIK